MLEDAHDDPGITVCDDLITQGNVEHLPRQLPLSPRSIVTAKDAWGATLPHWAASCANMEAIRLLLTAGADTNSVCKRGRSVLHWAM